MSTTSTCSSVRNSECEENGIIGIPDISASTIVAVYVFYVSGASGNRNDFDRSQ